MTHFDVSSCRQMPSEHMIQRPELLSIGGYGAPDQIWYRDEWQRRAGCGPTNAALMMRYLAHAGAAALDPYDSGTQQGFLALMEDLWQYVTPTRRGVNSTAIFADGVERYAADRGVQLRTRTLEVPACKGQRPSAAEAAAFLAAAFDRDQPVAFLNLSNGELKNLDNWHWVTLYGLDEARMTANMADQRKRTVIDLALWLRTTMMGGGFVTAAAE